jgi:DNA-directed RNA polymerase specialized sigma24 family protein
MSPKMTVEDVVERVACEEAIAPHVAAVALLDTFRTLARLMCRDRHLQEDVVQEMALSALMDPEPRSLTAYCVSAVWRGKNYLRLWYQQKKRPGCVVNSRSVYDPEEEEREREAAEKAEAAAGEMRAAG